MPRQTKDSTPQLAVKNLPPALPNLPISPSIELLRRDWRWASISQFLFTFGQAAGLSTWDIDLFEADLDSPEEDVLTPDTVTKLLYILTYDKTVKRQNLEVKLREQYLARSPKRNPFGTDTHPRLWGELGLGQKIDALYRVCEWQWSNPQRFRALLNDDEPTAWRVEPIGWDKEENCYWLFDDNRLWVQHPAPKPPKPPPKPKGASKKAKQAAARAKSKDQASSRPKPAPKPKPVADDEGVEEDQPESSSRTRSRRNVSGRAASPSLDVIQKLIAEEKGLRSTRKRTRDQISSERAREELNSSPAKRLRDRTGRAAPSTFTTPSKPSPATASGRSTRRTRATMGEDEFWQPIPDEWLTPSKTGVSKAASSAINSAGKQTPNGKKGKGKETPRRKTGLESDTDDSELSELSDDEQIGKESMSPDQADGPASSELSAEPEESMIVVGDGAQASRKSTPLSEAEERIPEPSRTMLTPDDEQPTNGGKEESGPVELEPDDVQVDTEAETNLERVPEAENGVAAIPETSVLADQKMNVDEEPLLVAEGEPTGPAWVVGDSNAEAVLDGAVDDISASLESPAMTAAQTADEADRTNPTDLAWPPAEAVGVDTVEAKPVETETPPVVAPNGTSVENAPVPTETTAIKQEEEEEEDPDDEVLLAAKKALNPGFLEWECVCATRWDWENWPEQFAGSRHPDEKAFYAHIAENTRPAVLVFLREKEVQRAKEEAVRNRKRSSRIAMRELEKEEAARMEEVRRDLEARMQKVRDDEAKEAAIEADKLAKEKEREDRLKDREERLKQREDAIAQRAIEEIRAKEEAEKAREFRAQKRLAGESAAASGASTSIGKTGKGKGSAVKAEQSEEDEDDWELACEVCKQHGWNVDDDRNIACCESCGRWQHTDCHDEHDDRLGRPRRDWDKVDFYCSDCRKRLARERKPNGDKAQGPQTSPGQASAQPPTPKLRFSVPNTVQVAEGSPTSGRSKPQPRANGKASTGSARKGAASVKQMKTPRPPSEKKAFKPPKSPKPAKDTSQPVNAGSMHTPQSSSERHASANGASNGRPQVLGANGTAYQSQSRGHASPPGQYTTSFHSHPQNGLIHAGMPAHHPRGPPIIMVQGLPAQPMPPSAAGPPPQLYLQSGQPVYRSQIQPMYATQGQPVYHPSPSPQLAPTPSRSQASQSPAQYYQHASSPHRPQNEQSRPQPMYSAVSPSTQHVQAAYRAQAQSPPGHHYAQHSNGSISGRMPYAQMGVPQSSGQPCYAQQQVETQRYMHQQPLPGSFSHHASAQPPQYAPPRPPPPSSR